MKMMKPVLATLIAAGLVAPAFAADSQSDYRAFKAASTHSKMKTHQTKKSVDHGWKDRVHFGASAQAALGTDWTGVKSARNITLAGLTRANLFADMAYKDVAAHFDLYYNGFPAAYAGRGIQDYYGDRHAAEAVSSAYASQIYGNNVGNVAFDEALITVNHVFDQPMYVKVGKGYLPFGHVVDHYAMLPTFSNMWNMRNEHLIEVGYTGHEGLSAKGYVFKVANTHALNHGFQFGYEGHQAQANYHVSLSYLNDATRINFGEGFRGILTFFLQDFQPLIGSYDSEGTWSVSEKGVGAVVKQAPMYSVHADVSANHLTLDMDYTKMLQPVFAHESRADLGPRDDYKPLNMKFGILGFGAHYNQMISGHSTDFGVSYETVRDSDKNSIGFDKRLGFSVVTELNSMTHAKLEYAKYDQTPKCKDDACTFPAYIKNTQAVIASVSFDL